MSDFFGDGGGAREQKDQGRDSSAASSGGPSSSVQVQTMMGMGFPQNAAEHALKVHDGNIDLAIVLLLDHGPDNVLRMPISDDAASSSPKQAPPARNVTIDLPDSSDEEPAAKPPDARVAFGMKGPALKTPGKPADNLGAFAVRPAVAAKKMTHCPSNHTLKGFLCTTIHTCDVCNFDLEDDLILRCDVCNFDVCAPCAGRAPSKAPTLGIAPPAPLAKDPQLQADAPDDMLSDGSPPREKSADPKKSSCPDGHEMEELKTKQVHTCDKCSSDVAKNNMILRCNACNYDCCCACAGKPQPKRVKRARSPAAEADEEGAAAAASKKKGRKDGKSKACVYTADELVAFQRSAVANLLGRVKLLDEFEHEPPPAHHGVFDTKVITGGERTHVITEPNLKSVFNSHGEVKPDAVQNREVGQIVVDWVSLSPDFDLAQKAKDHWWLFGYQPKVSKYHKGKVQHMPGGFTERFDQFSKGIKQNFSYSFGGARAATYLEGIKGMSLFISKSSDRATQAKQYFCTSVGNIDALKSQLDRFCSAKGRNQFVPFRGVLDEQCVAGLGIESMVMLNAKTFGQAVSQQPAGKAAFGHWHPFQQDTIERLGTFDLDRDMITCLYASCMFEEKLKSHRASGYFSSGDVSGMPIFPFYGTVDHQDHNGTFAKPQIFCDHCGKWIFLTNGDSSYSRDVGRDSIDTFMHDHLQTCAKKQFALCKAPADQTDRLFKGFRLFKQTVGSDIGVTIHFEHREDGKVRLKICALFEQLLRRMLYMGYWPHDSATAKWRILKNQPFDCVSTTNRDAPEYPMKMKNSLDMPRATTPDCFLHNLKGEQPHTLSWMFAREGRDLQGRASDAAAPPAFKSRQRISRRVAGSDVKVEVELERSFDRVRGGLLGDQVGYGKTACMIALIAATRAEMPIQRTITDWEKRDYAKDLLFTNATLIVTPSNLFAQWSSEFDKFIDKKKLKLNIVRVGDYTGIKCCSVRDIMEADVVLVSFRFFFSDRYRQTFDEFVEVNLKDDYDKDRKHEYFTDRMVKCRQEVLGHMKANTLDDMLDEQALLEEFYWKRVVFDEFHEVVLRGIDDKIQQGSCVSDGGTKAKISFYSLRNLHARFHWGLTATPLLASGKQVAHMASLFHVYVPEYDDRETRHFVDSFIRANKWNFGAVKLEEQWVKVEHSARERALYLHHQQAAAGVGNPGGQLSETQREKLLKFCSHFSPDGRDQSEGSAVERTRKENLNQQKEQRSLLARYEAEKAACEADLGTPFIGKGGLPLFITCHHPNRLRNLIQTRSHQIATTKNKIRDLEASLRFFDSTIKSLCDAGDGGDRQECCICLDDMESHENTSLTKCGHVFCTDCIVPILQQQGSCPQCRAPARPDSLTNVGLVRAVIKSKKEGEEAAKKGTETREQRRNKCGSKVLAVVELIEKIRAERNGEKVIVFVQWDKIRETLAQQIKSVMGFEPHVLIGDTRKRPKILSTFEQSKEAKDQVLLLSLETSASGTNLICANHCILVHPMFGPNAVDFEKQAIGRVRRQGQPKTCYLYRLYTEGTVEEDIMKKHSQELQNLPMPEDKARLGNKEPDVQPKPANAHVVARSDTSMGCVRKP